MRKNLAIERKNAQLTQAQLASQLNVTIKQYNRLETGTSDGSIKVWKKLRQLLDKPIDYLLEQEVTEKEPDGNPTKNDATTA